MYTFHARGAQKLKKDSQVVSLFMLLGSTSVKAERKYVGEIEPCSVFGEFHRPRQAYQTQSTLQEAKLLKNSKSCHIS